MSAFRLMIILILLTPGLVCQMSQQDKKLEIQRKQIEYRESIGMKYGENTQTITFSLIHTMQDFVIKVSEKQQIKATMHTYWREQNIYISSQYREGENVRIIVYQDNNRIILDQKFYITTGFKFEAQQGKSYTLRFIDEGKIGKLVALETSRSNSAFESKVKSEEHQQINKRVQTLAQQIKSLFAISDFGIMLHEKNSFSVNHSTCIYMGYLFVEAAIIVVLVGLQVRYLMGLLKQDSVI